MKALALAAALAGCASDAGIAGKCEVRSQSQALTAEERKAVGGASPYPADALLRAREDELAGSQRARRAVAWQAVERAVDPVALAIDVPAGDATLPRWQTWYGRDDLHRIFQKVWRGLPGDARRARQPIPDAALDAGFAWDPHALDDDPAWSQARWDAYVASLADASSVHGAGGIDRIGYAPSTARTLLAGYAQQMACLANGAPEPFVDAPPAAPVVTREPLELGACEDRTYGPYFVASGEQLSAYGEARVAIHRGDADGAIACEAAAGEHCTIAGPGAVWITASADGAAVTGTLVVEDVAPSAPWAGCLASRFPGDAALVKANWLRADLGFHVPVHDTSASALAARLAGDGWGAGEAEVDPGPDDIYTARTENGEMFRLTALHLMTRELDHWLWVTLWWSPDPASDFGADRPAALTGVWSHYKMCTATAFAEGDPDPAGGYAADHPDLGAALAVVSTPGGPSWCSNPYLEGAAGQIQTNCLGCHQHGGSQLDPTALLGRTLVRNNFPVDYSWQSDRGDMIGSMLRDEVIYWDSVP